MNETRHEAAERIQVLLNREPGLLTVAEETDLRTVLAENREMRERLAALQTTEAVLWYDDEHDCWRPSEFRTVAEAIDEEGGQLRWCEGSRLVGTWQPADDPAPDGAA